MALEATWWAGKRVAITGHTGFKGSWLALLLARLGARATGIALAPQTRPNLFEAAGIEKVLERSYLTDIRDTAALASIFERHDVEIVFHLAAQSLVLQSYADPAETFSVNVQGTVSVLEAARRAGTLKSAVIVTSDKCYENREWVWPYREADALGGRDPYSASKGAAEIVTASYARSFFGGTQCAVVSARAGNVIGGGDWAANRIVPDMVRAIAAGVPLEIRNPAAVRPWQHVLEPLAGYALLARASFGGTLNGEAFNFGPDASHERNVRWVADAFFRAWGKAHPIAEGQASHHEARFLSLDSSKARRELQFQSLLSMDETVAWTARWYREHAAEADARTLCNNDIEEYLKRDQQ